MTIPDRVREDIKRGLWETADRIHWEVLSAPDKTRQYENWTSDASIGGVLGHYMDRAHVRVYLKDTILKGYAQARLADWVRPCRAAGLNGTEAVAESYAKPHGKRLVDGRVVCWGRADDWKLILMALHERAFRMPTATPFAAVLYRSLARFHEGRARAVVADAAQKLGIEHLVWLEL